MPAAAVIPAPIAYIKVVAVKKLVVEVTLRAGGSGFKGRLRLNTPLGAFPSLSPVLRGFRLVGLRTRAERPVLRRGALHRVSRAAGQFTLNK